MQAILSLGPEDKVNERYRSGGEVIKRHTSKGTQIYDTDESLWPLNKPVPKLEALVQCSGEATFANDLPSQTNEIYGAFVTADIPPGSILTGFDTADAFVSLEDLSFNYCFRSSFLTISSHFADTQNIPCASPGLKI